MRALPNGAFVESFTTEISKGLRPSKQAPRNSKYLVQSQGVVGYEGVLKVLDTLSISSIANDPNIILSDFPFPQLFILDKHILVCNRQSILELQDNVFILVISGLAANNKWNVLSSHDFIYLTNGAVAVIRSPESNTYSISSTAPISSAVCNFNGQCIVGDSN